MQADVATYVYGVVPATATPPRADGLRGAPLELVRGDGAAAIVSEVDSDELLADREDLTTHARVLEQAAEHGVVLPMRFGVVMPDPDSVRAQLLDPYREELLAQMADLNGKAEMHLRVTYQEQPLMREIVSANPEIARARESLRGQPDDATYFERIRVGEMVAAAVEETRAQDADALLAPLLDLVVAAEYGTIAHERSVLNASFLVERERLDDFDAAVEALARDQAERMRFRLTGPLPPHSFVELSVGE